MPFLDEIAAKLVSAGVGVIGSSIFLGTRADIPPGNGPYLSLVETGGFGPTRIHNEDAASTQQPTAQIMVRARTYLTARAMSKAAYLALDGTFNTTLSGTFYLRIAARQEPTDIGLEEGTNRARVAFNIEAEKRPS